jgi:hypothetical protein
MNYRRRPSMRASSVRSWGTTWSAIRSLMRNASVCLLRSGQRLIWRVIQVSQMGNNPYSLCPQLITLFSNQIPLTNRSASWVKNFSSSIQYGSNSRKSWHQLFRVNRRLSKCISHKNPVHNHTSVNCPNLYQGSLILNLPKRKLLWSGVRISSI